MMLRRSTASYGASGAPNVQNTVQRETKRRMAHNNVQAHQSAQRQRQHHMSLPNEGGTIPEHCEKNRHLLNEWRKQWLLLYTVCSAPSAGMHSRLSFNSICSGRLYMKVTILLDRHNAAALHCQPRCCSACCCFALASLI